MVHALPEWRGPETFRCLMYIGAALLAANWKVKLPGISGTMSVTFVFILISLPNLSLPQVVVVGLAGTGGQLLFRAKTRNWVRLLFNLSSSTLSSMACFAVYHAAFLRKWDSSLPMLLLFATAVQFLMNTGSVSVVIAMTEGKSPWRVWKENFLWTASHHFVGAGLAALFHAEESYLGWQATVLTVPVIYFVHRSYSMHLERLESARQHAQEMGDLHWRTIEALALAIDAKDETTHNHLLRVKVYATEISKELNLEDIELQAIQAAALLHDIGKLAVPEHIISKPGKLTAEEFEKMKVHPVVGAEILERVRFPYPVVPIVRSHHEKWNGKGYPAGLKGEEIPIGARILAAVDCLDALASDRQYRKALPLDQAMAIVEGEAGQSFDPKIVAILKRRYVELEKMATSLPCGDEPKLSKNVKVDAGEGPASGYAELNETASGPVQIDFLKSITAARREFQSLLGVIEDLGTSLSVDETLALLAKRLKKMIPHESSAIFVREGDHLVPAQAAGDDGYWIPRTAIRVGEGLTGWVAENHQPIVNGNPSVEPGYWNGGIALLSAISVPFEANGVVVGAVSLYSRQVNAFTQDHLRVLLQISPRAGLTLANALQHERTAASAATDELTGLPNARSLFLYFAEKLAESVERNENGAVLVIDLDGFKNVNDHFGHLTGNQVLRRIGDDLRKAFSGEDYVARLGGDEFVVVLPRRDRIEVNAVIGRLSRLVEEAGEEICGSQQLALSVGTAFYPRDGSSAEQLLAAADERMYQMKEEHRMTATPYAGAGRAQTAYVS